MKFYFHTKTLLAIKLDTLSLLFGAFSCVFHFFRDAQTWKFENWIRDSACQDSQRANHPAYIFDTTVLDFYSASNEVLYPSST